MVSNSRAYRVVGADVGGTHVRAGVVAFPHNGSPEPVGAMVRRRWRAEQGPASVKPNFSELADSLVSAHDALVSRLDIEPKTLPLGIGFAGQLSRDGTVLRNAPSMGWRDLPVRDALAEALALPSGQLALTNDLNAILAGELAAGAARGERDVVACYVGTGIGGAVAVGGEIVIGRSGIAGEIGHVKLPGIDARCGCGQIGCVEAVAGGAAIRRRLAAEAASGEAAHLIHDDRDQPEVDDVDEAWSRGDDYARALWSEVASHLGFVLAGALAILNPGLLVLGGGVLAHAPNLRAEVERRTLERALESARVDLRVASGTLGEWAGIIGAATLAHRRAVLRGDP